MSTAETVSAEARLAEIEARAWRQATACAPCALSNTKATDGRPPRALWRCDVCGAEVCGEHHAQGACFCESEGTVPRYVPTGAAGADVLVLAADSRRLRAALRRFAEVFHEGRECGICGCAWDDDGRKHFDGCAAGDALAEADR